MKISTALSRWLDLQTAPGPARHLAAFEEFCALRGLEDLAEFTENVLVLYSKWLQKRYTGWTPPTRFPYAVTFCK